MQEPVTPQAVVDGTAAGGSSGAAEAAVIGYLNLCPPMCRSRERLNDLLKGEAPPPLQMSTMKTLGIVR
jgi:hypothetical protein